MTKNNNWREELKSKLDYREKDGFLYKSGFDNCYEVDEEKLIDFIAKKIKEAKKEAVEGWVDITINDFISVDKDGNEYLSDEDIVNVKNALSDKARQQIAQVKKETIEEYKRSEGFASLVKNKAHLKQLEEEE